MPVPISTELTWSNTMDPNMSFYDYFNDTMISDDVWKKFELDLPLKENSLLNGTDFWEPDSFGPFKNQIRHHDCMWSGRCIDKSHPEKKCSYLPTVPSVVPIPPVVNVIKVQNVTLQSTPAGRSLLLNSRNNIQNKMKPIVTMNKPVMLTEIKKEPEEVKRPDTPQSLDEETFRAINPAACNMGTNRMALNNGFKEFNIMDALKHITNAKHNDKTKMNDNTNKKSSKVIKFEEINTETLKDLENAISDYDFDEDSHDLCEYFDSDSNEEDDDDEEDEDDDEDDDDEEDDEEESSIDGSMNGSFQGTTDIGPNSDHCYTFTKGRMENLGVQTPSDSEEEIDVVSIGDKSLPTNPSARDRRQLQSTVARKISVSNIVKQPGGVKTVPPRRSSEDRLKPVKRKRQSHRDDDEKPPKKQRNKKKKSSAKKNADDDDLDTLEKRCLHNNMERQRRISLKNLFDDLKVEIPSIRYKDRAPKVNILREATLLCTKYSRDQEQLLMLKRQQTRLLARVRTLRTSLAHMRVK